MKSVSILIAARNEAANILDCLRSVEALSYDKENLQILVGNDASEDDTAAIVRDFIADKPHFTIIDVQPNKSNALRGKTNVLAQLADHATGEYLFFTDADIEVPTDWIQNILPHFKPNVGIVTGITTMKNGNLFALMQGLEWLYYLSLVRLFSLFNIPITAMGNNMAVTRTAYNAVGGYEKVGFSITEDYALFRAILAQGFQFAQLFDYRILTISKPIPTFAALLVQRKRWMYGAMSLPWQQRIGVYINGLLLPILLIIGFFDLRTALILTTFAYIAATAWLAGGLSWLQKSTLWIGLPVFWFYHIFTNFAMLIYFYTASKTVWKGRSYQISNIR